MFQPTHPHGVRPTGRRKVPKDTCLFQPTHPHGVRPWDIEGDKPFSWVSTHAPARGATWPGWGRRWPGRGFNPRTRTGCDFERLVYHIQSGVRFNPRTRTGCDYQVR